MGKQKIKKVKKVIKGLKKASKLHAGQAKILKEQQKLQRNLKRKSRHEKSR